MFIPFAIYLCSASYRRQSVSSHDFEFDEWDVSRQDASKDLRCTCAMGLPCSFIFYFSPLVILSPGWIFPLYPGSMRNIQATEPIRPLQLEARLPKPTWRNNYVTPAFFGVFCYTVKTNWYSHWVNYTVMGGDPLSSCTNPSASWGESLAEPPAHQILFFRTEAAVVTTKVRSIHIYFVTFHGFSATI